MTKAPVPKHSPWGLRLSALTLLLGCLAALTSGGCRRKALLPRGDGQAVVFEGPDAGDEGNTPLAASAETEPNNTADQAQKVFMAPWPLVPGAFVGDQPLAIGAAPVWAVEGLLADTGDVDTYRVILVPPGGFPAPSPNPVDAGGDDAGGSGDSGAFASLAISVVLSDTGLANGVTVTLESGNPVVRVLQQTTTGEPLAIPNAGLVAGEDLLVKVTRAKRGKAAKPGDAGPMRLPYRLAFKAATPLAGEEVEPNSAPHQASPLSSRTATVEAVGYLGWRQDTDWFALSFPPMNADFALTIELDLPADALAGLSVATDGGGKTVHGYARPATGKLRLTGVAVPKEGPVWLRIQNAGAAVLNQRYRLTASAVHLPSGYETEPNDALGNAVETSAPTQVGFVHPAGDVDSFKLCGSAAVPFVVESPARLDLTVSVLDLAGVALSSGLAVGGRKTTFGPLPDTPCCVIQIRETSGKLANLLDPYSIRTER